MKNVLDNEANNLHLYYQYRENAILVKFFQVIHSYINNNYFKFLKIALENTQPLKAKNNYLTFWALHMLGLNKPLGAASLNTFYDVEDQYDNMLTYDDSNEYDGTIGLREFSLYLKFILNYSIPVLNIHSLVMLCDSFCNFENLKEIKIESSLNGVIIRIPQTQSSAEFLKLLRVYYDDLGLPFGINLEVRYINVN